jgi:hypothetical protein
MFGKAEWFKKGRLSWGMIPVCWQGWLYLATWLAVVLLPFFFLRRNLLMVESLIWMGASLAAAGLDARAVLRTLQRVEPSEDALRDAESESVSEELATRNYEFRLHR